MNWRRRDGSEGERGAVRGEEAGRENRGQPRSLASDRREENEAGTNVDVGPEILLNVREGSRLGLLDGLVDLGLGRLVDRLERLLVRNSPLGTTQMMQRSAIKRLQEDGGAGRGGKTHLGDVLAEAVDAVLGGAHLLDLLTRSVGGSRVRHAARGMEESSEAEGRARARARARGKGRGLTSDHRSGR